MRSRGFAIAVGALAAVFITQPGIAASDWPESVDQYVVQVRKSLDTTDMEGYLAVVRDPKGALLVDAEERVPVRQGRGQIGPG